MSSGLNVPLGAWAAVSPWILGYYSTGTLDPSGTVGGWSNVAAGGLVAIFASLRIWSPGRRSTLSWINVLLGGLIALSAWIFEYASDDLRLWNDVVTGSLIAMLASWSGSTTAVYRSHGHLFET